MKNFFFVLLLAICTFSFTAMDMQMATAPPPTETIVDYDTPTYYNSVGYTEVGEGCTYVQELPQIRESKLSVNPEPVQSVDKTHRARYDIDHCQNHIVIFNQGNAISTYDLRQKSGGLFHFLRTGSPIYGRRCNVLS